MAVYVINNLILRDRAAYDEYLRSFMEVFRKFDGEVLAVVDAPQPIEGSWPYDRTVLLRFPDREEMLRWSQSPEYQAIAVHRHRGTTSNVVVLDGLPPRR